MGYGVTLSKLRKLTTGQSSQSSRPSGSSTSRLCEVEYEWLRAEMDERMHTEIEWRMTEYKTQIDAQLQTQLSQMMAQFSSTPPVPPATVPRDEFCGFHPALFALGVPFVCVLYEIVLFV